MESDQSRYAAILWRVVVKDGQHLLNAVGVRPVETQKASLEACSCTLHKDLHKPVLHRSRPTTQKRRPPEKLDRSWTTTRTEKTRLTSRERVCSSSMMSGGTPRRRRGTPPFRLIPPGGDQPFHLPKVGNPKCFSLSEHLADCSQTKDTKQEVVEGRGPLGARQV